MEHESLGEVVRAFESIGTRFSDSHAFVPCRRCKRTRRFSPAELAGLRTVGYLFCRDCLTALSFATTQQRNQIII
jgi:hypothetical protein